MNRIIDVRAWDDIENKFIYPTQKLPKDYFFGFNSKGLECSKYLGKGAFRIFPLMQFTGILDKNGKKIYEGDILNLYCSANKGQVVTATVEWNGISFYAKIHDKKVFGGTPIREVKMLEMHSWCGDHDCLTGWPKNLEVIGTIYEKPELLCTKS